MVSGRTVSLDRSVELGILTRLPRMGEQQMKEQLSRVIQEES